MEETMLKQTPFYAVLFTLALSWPVNAQQTNAVGTPMPPEFNWSLDEPITRNQVTVEMEKLKPGENPTSSALTTMVTWVSNTVGLPANYDLPRVERVPHLKLAAVFHGSQFVSPGRGLGIYDDDKKAILLPSEWTGSKPEDLSILVHEMVHHLQNLAGLQFQCPQEREKLAYIAQERWLAASGRSLEMNFRIDPETFLFNTECYIP
jgi:uncharacterized protein DUF6647